MERSRPFLSRKTKFFLFPKSVESQENPTDPNEENNSLPFNDGEGSEDISAEESMSILDPDNSSASKVQGKETASSSSCLRTSDTHRDGEKKEQKRDQPQNPVLDTNDENANNTDGFEVVLYKDPEENKTETYIESYNAFLVDGREGDEDNFDDLNLVLESEDDSDEYIPPTEHSKSESSEEDTDEITYPNIRRNTCLTKKKKVLKKTGKQDKGPSKEVIDKTKDCNSGPSSKEDVPPAPRGGESSHDKKIDGSRDDGNQNFVRDGSSGCVISVTAGEVRARGSFPFNRVVSRVVPTGGLLGSGEVPFKRGGIRKLLAVPRKTGGTRSSLVFPVETGGRPLSKAGPSSLKAGGSLISRVVPIKTGGSILPAIPPQKTGGLLGSAAVVARKTGGNILPAVTPDKTGGLVGSLVVNRKTGVVHNKPCSGGRLFVPGEAAVSAKGPVGNMGLDQTQGGVSLLSGGGVSVSGGGSQEQTSDEQDVKVERRLNIMRHLSRSVEKTEKENKRLRRLLKEVKPLNEEFRHDENEKDTVEVIEID